MSRLTCPPNPGNADHAVAAGSPVRLGGLDGLRAIAALGVFCVHVGQIVDVRAVAGPVAFDRVLANGELGVALFFCLSGFLLSRPFWSVQGGARLPNLASYATGRVARILPGYYLALLVLVVASGLWHVPGGWSDVLLHATFLFNYADFSFFGINPPFWTIGMEVQMYLLLPVAFALVRGQRAAVAVVVLAGVAIASWCAHVMVVRWCDVVVAWPFAAHLNWFGPYGPTVNQSILAHLPHFLLGVIAGRWGPGLRSGADAVPARLVTITVTTMALLLGVVVALDLADRLAVPMGRYGLPLVPAILAVLVLAVCHCAGATRLLDAWPLRALGRVSYGLYLWHLPCLIALDQALMRRGFDAVEHWVVFTLGGLALSLLMASVSWWVVERPALALAQRYRVSLRKR